jgi:thiosulfate/3-mercaptopyruvate sulfurtransferase
MKNEISPDIDPVIAPKGYAHPELLVSTEWLAAHLNDPNIRIVESDEDVLLYDTGHIPGAQKVDWHEDLNDSVVRDYVSPEHFEQLLRSKGIDESKTVIFYGDKNNWWAAYAYWVFQLFGFRNAKLLDGGRIKWQQEGRPMDTAVPKFDETKYKAPQRSDQKIRAFFQEVRDHSESGRRERCEAGTSPERRVFRGGELRIPTELSNPPMSCARFTKPSRDSSRRTM